MNVVLFAIAIAWGVRIFLNILSYIHLWYIKEYRFDRMLIHLKSTQGKRLWLIGWRYPPFTLKTATLLVSSIAGLIMIFNIVPLHLIVTLFVIDVLSFIVVSLLVAILKIPTSFYHHILILLAKTKLRAHKPMIVIGITGSYGKTSTKEILATILRQKYKTLKTISSKNSLIAISELLLNQLRPDHEVFIVEMGAYKMGEIADMCRMVHPEIGIVTAINAQHQDLFGGIQHTVEAKYELLAGLSGRRIGIVNQDNSYVADMGKRASREGVTIIGYSAKKIPVSQNANGIRFQSISVRLFGIHQISNVLAAMAAAKAVGMTKQEIIRATHAIRPLPHTMNPIQGINGSVFIDDTFNNNPDAAIAALDYLANRSGRKILVFQPMIELGQYARKSHVIVAKHAAKICDEIILTNDTFADVFGERCAVLSAHAAAKHLKETLGPGHTVLFKGKEASRVLQLLV